MSFLDKLERRIGWLAIPGLIRIVVGFNALVFILMVLDREFINLIDLDPRRVMRGEVWRLFTYVFIPQTTSFFWIVFALMFLFFIGESLERAWGAFRLTLFYLVGMIGCTVAAFFFGGDSTNTFI